MGWAPAAWQEEARACGRTEEGSQGSLVREQGRPLWVSASMSAKGVQESHPGRGSATLGHVTDFRMGKRFSYF